MTRAEFVDRLLREDSASFRVPTSHQRQRVGAHRKHRIEDRALVILTLVCIAGIVIVGRLG